MLYVSIKSIIFAARIGKMIPIVSIIKLSYEAERKICNNYQS